jgi:hypothetical protein
MIGSISKIIGRAEFMPMAGPAPSFAKSYTEQISGFLRPRLFENNIYPLVVKEIQDSRDMEGHSMQRVLLHGRWDMDVDQ